MIPEACERITRRAALSCLPADEENEVHHRHDGDATALEEIQDPGFSRVQTRENPSWMTRRKIQGPEGQEADHRTEKEGAEITTIPVCSTGRR